MVNTIAIVVGAAIIRTFIIKVLIHVLIAALALILILILILALIATALVVVVLEVAVLVVVVLAVVVPVAIPWLGGIVIVAARIEAAVAPSVATAMYRAWSLGVQLVAAALAPLDLFTFLLVLLLALALLLAPLALLLLLLLALLPRAVVATRRSTRSLRCCRRCYCRR